MRTFIDVKIDDAITVKHQERHFKMKRKQNFYYYRVTMTKDIKNILNLFCRNSIELLNTPKCNKLTLADLFYFSIFIHRRYKICAILGFFN